MIRNLSLFTNSLWDWGVFDPCLSDGCKVSDLDGQVERRGQFLVIEAKAMHVLERGIPSGQARMFNRYLELGHYTTLILYGDPGKYRQLCILCGHPASFDKEPPAPKYMQIWPRDPMPCNLALVQEFIRGWFRFADDQPVPLITGDRRRGTSVLRAPTIWTDQWLFALSAIKK